MADPTEHGAAGQAARRPDPAAGTRPAAETRRDGSPAEELPDTAPVEEVLDDVDPQQAPPVEGDEPAPPLAPDEPADAGSDALADALAERDRYRDLHLRKAAEFDNFRKRKQAEVGRAESRGVAKVAKELLSSLDHFDLALKAAADGEGGADVVKGFAIIRDEIVAALARVGVEVFSPTGEVFDPNEHEAMVAQPAEGAESGTVLEVYQSGYRVEGAVLRPARVVVAA